MSKSSESNPKIFVFTTKEEAEKFANDRLAPAFATEASAAPEAQTELPKCSPLDSQLAQQLLEAIRQAMAMQESGTLQIQWIRNQHCIVAVCGSPGSPAPADKLPPFLRTDRENPH